MSTGALGLYLSFYLFMSAGSSDARGLIQDED